MSFRFSSMPFKLFLLCFLFMFGTVTFVSQLSYRFIQNEIRENNDFFISQISSKVDQYITLSFSSLQTILSAVDSSYTPGMPSFETMKPQLQQLYELNFNLISNVYVVKNDTGIVGGSPLSAAFDHPSEERSIFLQQTAADKLGIFVSSPYVSKQSGWTVTLTRYLHGSQPMAIAALDMDLNAMEKTLLQINRDDLVSIVIMDGNGRMIAGSLGDAGKINVDNRTFQLGELSSEDLLAHSGNVIPFKSGKGGQWTVRKYPASHYNWTILTLYNDSLTKRSLRHIEPYYFGLLGIGLLLSAITAGLLARFIRKPLGNLMTKMKLIKQGFLDIPLVMNRKDEFGELSRTFDQMIKQITELVESLRSNKELKRELEIQVLQSQINPHFLYNTLGSISNVVRLGMVEHVDPIIKSLIKILEYGIGDVAEKVTLRDELLNVRDYIFIQNIRYSSEFEVIEEIETKLYDFPVFRMLLQPIVENSMFHAYSGGRTPGRIIIRASYNDDHVEVEVEDFGTGMSNLQLELLLLPGHPMNADKRRRIGLINIHQRIQLNYGEAYGLEVRSEMGKGTCVKARFPWNDPGKQEVDDDEKIPLPDRR
ncbi:cache domain-containing sensor histidine kinase [Paenibacillus agricola]|uniref:Histidine kinase n=1 Tax=Paenibacillus agricola TaxID=2716264 RepID=A0ABX0J6U3_9BACL|nr:sensor histidine kinase [Paenibacillus agricola]NHN31862.1 histidine kinase [Paenibacillus agricola]